MPGKTTELLKSLSLTIITIVLLVFFSEFVLRVFEVPVVDREFHLMVKNLDEAVTSEPETLVENLTLLWQNKPGAPGIDENGRRIIPRTSELASKRTKVLFLGDSVTYGWKVAADISYPALVEKLGGGKIESINAGVIGYTSFQGLQQFASMNDVHPDVVVVSFYQNDEDESCYSDHDVYERNQKYYFSNWFAKNSLTWRFVTSKFLSLFFAGQNAGECSQKKFRVSPGDFRDNLMVIASLAKSRNARVLFVAHPTNPFDFKDTPPLDEHLADYRTALYEAAEAMDVPVLEVKELSKTSSPEISRPYFMDHCHLTQQGNELMAHAIIEKLRPI